MVGAFDSFSFLTATLASSFVVVIFSIFLIAHCCSIRRHDDPEPVLQQALLRPPANESLTGYDQNLPRPSLPFSCTNENQDEDRFSPFQIDLIDREWPEPMFLSSSFDVNQDGAGKSTPILGNSKEFEPRSPAEDRFYLPAVRLDDDGYKHVKNSSTGAEVPQVLEGEEDVEQVQQVVEYQGKGKEVVEESVEHSSEQEGIKGEFVGVVVEDLYGSHTDYTTRLSLHLHNSPDSPIGAASAGLAPCPYVKEDDEQDDLDTVVSPWRPLSPSVEQDLVPLPADKNQTSTSNESLGINLIDPEWPQPTLSLSPSSSEEDQNRARRSTPVLLMRGNSEEFESRSTNEEKFFLSWVHLNDDGDLYSKNLTCGSFSGSEVEEAPQEQEAKEEAVEDEEKGKELVLDDEGHPSEQEGVEDEWVLV